MVQSHSIDWWIGPEPGWIEATRPISKEVRKTGEPSPRILVVDDDEIFCRTIVKTAQHSALNVKVCQSLGEVLSLHKETPFDVAVLDYFFGEFSALQVGYILGRDIPIILISQNDRSAIHFEGWPLNIKGFVPKSKGQMAILENAIQVSMTPQVRLLANMERRVFDWLGSLILPVVLLFAFLSIPSEFVKLLAPRLHWSPMVAPQELEMKTPYFWDSLERRIPQMYSRHDANIRKNSFSGDAFRMQILAYTGCDHKGIWKSDVSEGGEINILSL